MSIASLLGSSSSLAQLAALASQPVSPSAALSSLLGPAPSGPTSGAGFGQSVAIASSLSSLVTPTRPAAAAGSGYALADSANNLVPVGAATDAKGQTVQTLTLKTAGGGTVAFQTAPPAGVTLTSTPPAAGAAPASALPTLVDQQGATVAASTVYDQAGGAVLKISLTDQLGHATTFFSQVDSKGNATALATAAAPPPGPPPPPLTDAFGTGVVTQAGIDKAGSPFTTVTLDDPNTPGKTLQFRTQVADAAPLTGGATPALSALPPGGTPVTLLANPTDAKGQAVASQTLFTRSGAAVQQITLFDAGGHAVNLFSVTDSSGKPTQAVNFTSPPPPPAPPPPTYAPFSANAGLTAIAGPGPSTVTLGQVPYILGAYQGAGSLVNLFPTVQLPIGIDFGLSLHS